MRTSKRKTSKGQTLLKVRLYIMSLWLLFVLIFVLTVNFPFSCENGIRFIGWTEFFKTEWLALISLFMAILSWSFTGTIRKKTTGAQNPPCKIISVKNENCEYLTFLTTYIIPLICIDLTKIRYVIVLAILLILIGYIFIKMELYYGNPTLALMGFRLYRAEIKNYTDADGIVLISQGRLHSDMSVKWIPVDENVWLVKEINE